MRRAVLVGVLLGFAAWPGVAWAVDGHYEAYAAGLNVISLDTRYEVGAERYRIWVAYRTVGALGVVVSSRQETEVVGRFAGFRPTPERFVSQGTLRGERRVTRIDYAGGRPQIRALEPANEKERETVPEGQQAGTVDTLSAMAELVHQVNTSGRCEGELMTFDGRRLAVLQARTTGVQVLEQTGRSSFAGPALRCDFVGRQLGGFMLDEDRATLARPQVGTAWFAAVVDGGPKVPVRVTFHTKYFGEATMYLMDKRGE